MKSKEKLKLVLIAASVFLGLSMLVTTQVRAQEPVKISLNDYFENRRLVALDRANQICINRIENKSRRIGLFLYTAQKLANENPDNQVSYDKYKRLSDAWIYTMRAALDIYDGCETERFLSESLDEIFPKKVSEFISKGF